MGNETEMLYNKRTQNPNLKVYVIDPKRYKQNQEREDVTFLTPSSSIRKEAELPGMTLNTNGYYRRNTLGTRTLQSTNHSLRILKKDETDEELLPMLAKPFKTRSGRVTKTTRSLPENFIPPVKVLRKGRPPPEYFRCQTCQKFYVGNTKLKAHLEKYPTHQPSLEYHKSITPKRKITQSSIAVQSDLTELTTVPSSSEGESQDAESMTSSLLPPPANAEIIFTPVTESSPPFREVGAAGLNPSPAPSPSSYLPFWNAFSYNSGRGEASPEIVPSTPSRKDETVDSTGIKTIWDLVEKKLTMNGINLILMELSDVAEKLGKIARDKIIPIREDEEERLPSSTPIVRVDNPFMSHLLDLPFGAYVFREDGGIRRPPLPPPSTDLSLTAGEVDIDKFLACNMEMDLSLPHLTSLDIAAVCNN